MPLVAITPLTQDCYEKIWHKFINCTFLIHEDSINELKNIFKFKANTFYSNPITRLEKIKDYKKTEILSLKGMAIKLLLDGQMGGWIGNKNSRVQTFFFSDVIDSLDDSINNPKDFSHVLIEKMTNKIDTYNKLLTPNNGILTIDISKILLYWGHHNINKYLFLERKKIEVKVLPNNESMEMFVDQPVATRRDSYHYHMLKKEKVDLILVGDANYKNNICPCENCNSYKCEIYILKDDARKQLLGLG
ncbi:MAG: hypothetical protein A4E71_00055 [Smithella sp. PtaU1.Bin162]|nr:MAG: hypothetical protein A4E71_00055 [Smithella sp. PtaU1.Bin162]